MYSMCVDVFSVCVTLDCREPLFVALGNRECISRFV